MKKFRIAPIVMGCLLLAQGANGQDIADAMKYIYMREFDTAKTIIESGINVNKKERGSYLMNVACHRGNPEMVRFLIEHGAHINVTAEDGSTPLYWAAGADEEGKLVKLLLERGAQINSRNALGSTPFNKAVFRAIQKGDNYGVLEILLDNGADVDAAPEDGQAEGYTPLMGAVINNSGRLATFLIWHGADVNVQAADGNAPLLIAAKEGNLELVKLLIDNGADPGFINQEGKTALQIAKEKGHKEVVSYLTGLQ